MKLQLKTLMATAAFIIITSCSFSQTKETRHVPGVSAKGYWVIESTIQHPRNHIIRFYTNDNMLVYTEKLEGIKLNPNKRKIRIKLNEVLEASVWAWNKNKEAVANKNYVAAKLK